jgi:precorrin-6B C5,15-methyltransferase / cobalt-precorrin-6B C5,C15-methyltransferase
MSPLHASELNTRAWLTIVGVGADGAAGLCPRARMAVEGAEVVVGSKRQLELVATLLHGTTLSWPSPFSEGIARVLSRRGQATCVLATGDPFFFGVGSTLAEHLAPDEFICHPAPSSLSLAAARLGWPLQDTDVVSLHGRELHTLARYLHGGRRLLVLSWSGETPARVAKLISERGFGASRLSVLEGLGGPEERCRSCSAKDYAFEEVSALNLVAVELQADAGAGAFPFGASLPDSAFEHDGQLTKQDVRAVTLAALCPRPGALLWDVGAGSGSVAIEWLLTHRACRAIAVERDGERCERILRNARALGVPELELVRGVAPEALQGLAAPDAIFIGGGANTGVIEACWRALATGGFLVVNAVSLETEALLLAVHAERGGTLRRLSIDNAAALGAKLAWRAALPVTQWRVQKP